MQARSIVARSRPLWPSLVIASVTCLALASGLDQGLWRDEAATADVAIRSWSQLFALLGHQEGGFAGYELFVHAWVAVSGTSEIAFRIPSLAAAFGTIVLAGLLAGRLGGRWAAPVASALVALNHSLTSYYGLEARSYALGTFFLCLAAVTAQRAGRLRTGRLVAAFACSAAVAVTMHFFVVLPAAVLLVWVAPALRVRPRAAWWLLLPLAATATMVVLTARARGLQSWIAVPSLRDVAVLGGQVVRPATALAAVALGVAWLLVRRSVGSVPDGTAPSASRRDLVVLAAWGCLPPLVLVAYSLAVSPVLLARYLLPCTVPFAILAGIGCDAVLPLLAAAAARGARVRVGAATLVLALAAVAGVALSVHQGAFTPADRPADLRAASRYVASHQRPGDALVFAPSWVEADFRWYLTDRPVGPLPRDVTATDRSAAQADSLYAPSASQSLITRRLDSARRVWVLGWVSPPGAGYAPAPDPGGPVVESLRRCWTRLRHHEIGSNTVVELWAPSSPAERLGRC
jgi:mannosyltransferase